jgi:hemerythrin superfamily protein
MSKQQTLLQAVAEDHREMYEYHEKYLEAKKANNLDEQERWVRQMIWEIARHAVGEELVVYPLMEKHLGAKGKEWADKDREEHQEVKILLSKLESLKAGTPEYDQTISEMMKHLREHNDSEERQDLPPLEEVLRSKAADNATDPSKEAAISFKRTKLFAPTRSHPSAPNKPPFETIAGLMAAPIDKLKDMFAKFPTEEMKS